MLAVGLTGGIGSGKSTVADLFADRGAVIVDADQVAREVVAPGGPAYAGVVERFGEGILDGDGQVDRQALARIVFDDPAALADLNGLTHPAVADVIGGRLAEEAASDHVVVLAIPLLAEGRRDRYRLDAVIVVDAPPEVALARLIRERGMAEEEARARMTAQASRQERLAIADVVIDNSSDLAHLAREVDRAWAWLGDRTRATG
ncbi:MAG TPA: dephospho-CoA kinase [Acidimicrobiales bacterium]|nr:dephospho-CoA kinase [Acidimicrobiales bacterium]